MNASTQSCQQMAFSFHHISVRFSLGSGGSGPGPVAESAAPENTRTDINPKTKSQEPSKKSVYVRKEFPETWLWTEEMVK